jgi:hypothetical protein
VEVSPVRVVPLIVVLLLTAVPVKGAEYHALGGGYRLLGLPNFTIDSTFDAHQPVVLHGATVHYSRGRWAGFWTFALAFGGTAIPDGFWQATNAASSSSVWVEYEIGFLGVVASYTWRFPLWRGLYVAPTLGLGLSAVLGDIYATEVLPGCKGDVHQCGHWAQVTRHPLELSSRLMPLLHLSGQLGYRITDELHVGLDLGLLNAPFAGISAEYAL